MLKFSIRVGVPLLIVFGIFLFTESSQALTLIPPSQEYSVNPGQTVQSEIKLYNETASPITLFSNVTNFSASGETGNPTYDFEALPTGLATWIDVTQGPLTLDPGQRIAIPITINVPAEAEPGGHFAALFFGDEPPEVTGNALAIGSKIGSLFLVRVAGDIVEQGTMAQILINEGGGSMNRLPVTISTRFQNSGNIHLRPSGTVTIKNLFGSTSATLEFNPSNGATLPQTVRKYDVTWEGDIVTELTGNFFTNFWTEFGNEWRNFALGKYTAEVNLSYGASSQSVVGSMTFWIMPWRVITLFIVILLLLVFGLIFFIKRYNKWVINKAQQVNSQNQNKPQP